MRNITVSVDEDTHRLARIRAAELDTSVSALVRDYLRRLGRGQANGTGPESPAPESARDRRSRMLDEVVGEITADGGGLRMADNSPPGSRYGRDALR